MKKLTTLIGSILFIVLLGLFLIISCKKVSEQHTVVIGSETSKSFVTNWYKQEVKKFSFKEKIYADSIIKKLDYSEAAKIQLETGTNLIIVKIFTKEKETSNYLGFTEKNGTYKTVGLIKLKGNKNDEPIYVVENFILHYKLQYKTSVEIWNLNNLLQKQFEGTANGKILFKEAKPFNKFSRNDYRINSLPSVNNIIAVECTDWYWVTYNESTGQIYSAIFLYRECPDGGGGGGGATETSEPNADDGPLSCKSFTFLPMTTNMYEAGVKGLQFVMDIAAGGGNITFEYRPIYIGFPSKTANGTTYTPNQAASITADAMNRAGASMQITYYGISTTQASTITKTQLENEFKTLVQSFISAKIGASATVSYIQSGSNTVTNNAVWNNGWDRMINSLTNSGCDY